MKYNIRKELENRILVLDGGLGTMVQGFDLTEEDYRGERFAGWATPLKGCYEVLVLTKPEVIESIHEAYFKAGADIVTTDTLNATSISMDDFGLEEHVYDMNRAAASLARRIADSFTLKNPSKPRFVAGSVGPTGKSASMSPDVNDPGRRNVTFDELVVAYSEQARGLIDGGADLFLIETIFDTLNTKAALRAIEIVAGERKTDIPVMVSATISDQSGRILSGQTLEAFCTSVSHAKGLLSIGLNCGFGAEPLIPYVERVSKAVSCYVSAHPNAGLPNVMGGYDETPEMMAVQIEKYLQKGLVNIVGGCCGTTPAHIGLITPLAAKYSPRPLPQPSYDTVVSGLESLKISPELNFINIGERTNVAGSAKFARLIREGAMEQALSIARAQVEDGAQIIDVCMDDGMIDGVKAMTEFLNLLASEPEIARVPVMIDSSTWEVLEAGMKCTQGKSIVNSISLKEGEKEFLRRARLVRSYGAAAVVMLFDERGQADTYKRKIQVARRAYDLLVEDGFPPQNIIFDPNVLAVATGMEEHNRYGLDFIEACRWIKQNLPHAKLSGGISNLSFSFRGNNTVREAMHSVFLYHAIAAGLDMGIVNPAMLQVYSEIPPELAALCEDVVLDRRPDAAERLGKYAAGMGADAGQSAPTSSPKWREGSVEERLTHAMLKGVSEYVAADTREAYEELKNPLQIIDTILMPAMEQVGALFGEGKMFLPQVVKTARVMKTAVGVLEPFIEGSASASAKKGAKVLISTVKGDVHDIGKNIVSVVMSCNGYQIKDMGVMVEAEAIVDAAVEWEAQALGLSGLITPSLEEMITVVKLMQERGLRIPVLIGGATTSALHTAVKIAPHYSGLVIQVRDAAENIRILAELLGPDSKHFEDSVRNRQAALREEYLGHRKTVAYRSLHEARRRGYVKMPQNVIQPRETGQIVFRDYPIAEVIPYIDWRFFFPAWGIKGSYPALLDSPQKGEEARKLFADAQRMLEQISADRSLKMNAVVGVLPASSCDDDIWIRNEERKKIVLAQLRNQQVLEGPNLCLADYLLSEQMVSEGDFIGLFAVSAGEGLEELAGKYRAAGDDYTAIMCKLLCDRLTAALAEVMHAYVRRKMWGFEKGEAPSPADMLAGKYQGLRYTFGYPACPDHSLKREVFELLNVEEVVPMHLTENYMIWPGESLCGVILADPMAEYFDVNRIDQQQLTDYAARRGMSIEEVSQLISSNL